MIAGRIPGPSPRARWPRRAAIAALSLWAGLAVAAPSALEYQDRGDRHEGIRPRPVGGADIEVISFRVDHRERAQAMPERLALRFFLHEASEVALTVRELEYRHYYWLDEVRAGPWRAGYGNVFEWPTADVLRRLDGVGVGDLGVVARVGAGAQGPSKRERLAPVILYQGAPPTVVKAYLLTARTNTPASLGCTVHEADSSREVFRQLFALVHAGENFTCRWDSSAAPDGPYRLVLEGTSLDTNDPLKLSIDFHHRAAVR